MNCSEREIFIAPQNARRLLIRMVEEGNSADGRGRVSAVPRLLQLHKVHNVPRRVEQWLGNVQEFLNISSAMSEIYLRSSRRPISSQVESVKKDEALAPI